LLIMGFLRVPLGYLALRVSMTGLGTLSSGTFSPSARALAQANQHSPTKTIAENTAILMARPLLVLAGAAAARPAKPAVATTAARREDRRGRRERRGLKYDKVGRVSCSSLPRSA